MIGKAECYCALLCRCRESIPPIEYVSTDGIYASSAAYQWIVFEMHCCDQTDGGTAPDAMRATEMMSLGREPYTVGLWLGSKKFDDLNFESEL